jgi:predicted FMN-binding regulatory protein PaiB
MRTGAGSCTADASSSSDSCSERSSWCLSPTERDCSARHVTDAPASFIDARIDGIVGLEIDIRRIEGKWKVSQNRPEADRSRVADGFEASGDASMARLVRGSGDRDAD